MVQQPPQLSRRQSLAMIVRLMLLVMLLAFIFVIVASLLPGEQNETHDNDAGLTIDVSELATGQLAKYAYPPRELWVYRRSEGEVAQLRQAGASLHDDNAALFVFFPYEPLRQCLVQWDNHERVFYDPCYANRYDLAGRQITTGQTAPKLALSVPTYHYHDGKLTILPPSAVAK